MCAVSMIIDTTRQQFPPLPSWPYQQLYDLSAVIRLLESIDKKLASRDCADAKKDAFLRELQAQLNKKRQAIPDLTL